MSAISITTSQEDDQENSSSSMLKNPDTSSSSSSSSSLFHRLGGVAVVRTAVGEFYTRLLDDAELSPFFENTKVVVLKQHQLEFFKLAFTEIPPDLDVAKLLLDKHDFLFAQYGLNAYHFDLVANHFVATLSHLHVPADLMDEAAGVILPLRVVFEQGALKYKKNSFAGDDSQKNSAGAGAGGAVEAMEKSETAAAAAAAPVVAHSTTGVLHASTIIRHEGGVTTDGDAAATTTTTTIREANLHDKLGGVAALKGVVQDFYARLLRDAELAPFFEDVNMTALKLHQVQFMKIAFTQIPDDLDVLALMRDKHASLFQNQGLNERHFDLVAQHFVATLHAANVEESVIHEAAAVILPLRVVFEQGAVAAATSTFASSSSLA